MDTDGHRLNPTSREDRIRHTFVLFVFLWLLFKLKPKASHKNTKDTKKWTGEENPTPRLSLFICVNQCASDFDELSRVVVPMRFLLSVISVPPW